MGFKKGNKAAVGHDGSKAGRPRKATTNAERDFLQGKIPEAEKIIAEALTCPDLAVRLDTAQWVYERLNGKAKQAIDMEVSGGMNLLDTIDAVRRSRARGVIEGRNDGGGRGKS